MRVTGKTIVEGVLHEYVDTKQPVVIIRLANKRESVRLEIPVANFQQFREIVDSVCELSLSAW